jgi:Uma2 family endonuclease
MATTTRTPETPSAITDAAPAASSVEKPPSTQAKVLPLMNGDRLTRAEFERRYSAMPHLKKAELIEGVVYVPSPVSLDHAEPHFSVIFALGLYWCGTPGVAGGDNGTLRLDLDNEPQPDAYLRIFQEYGGQARLSKDRYVEGSPELVAEVAASSASYDLHDKLRAYRRNGVREYIVWRVYDQAIDWFVLRDEQYQRLVPDSAGIYRSEVFPGLWLDAAALLRGDPVAVSQAVQQGLASPEHAAFVDRLKQAAQPSSPPPGTAAAPAIEEATGLEQ